MRLWAKSHHLAGIVCFTFVVIFAILFCSTANIGIPSLLYFGSIIPVPMFSSIPLILIITVFLDGTDPSAGAPVRNIRLYSTVCFASIVAILALVGIACIPLSGFVGVCTACTVLGCSSLGICCARIWGRAWGACASVGYIIVSALVGRPPVGNPMPWQFPLAQIPTLSELVVIAFFVMLMAWSPQSSKEL